MRFPAAGRFRDLVDIQKPTGTTGGMGEETRNAWTTIETDVRCDLHPIDAKEMYGADAEHNAVRYRVSFRWQPNLVKPRYRLVEKSVSPLRYLDVEGFINRGNERTLIVVKCVERF